MYNWMIRNSQDHCQCHHHHRCPTHAQRHTHWGCIIGLLALFVVFRCVLASLYEAVCPTIRRISIRGSARPSVRPLHPFNKHKNWTICKQRFIPRDTTTSTTTTAKTMEMEKINVSCIMFVHILLLVGYFLISNRSTKHATSHSKTTALPTNLHDMK